MLTSDGHEGSTYELAGDESWTLGDLAAEISRQIGTTIPYKNLPEAEYAMVLKSVGLPDSVAQAIAGTFGYSCMLGPRASPLDSPQ